MLFRKYFCSGWCSNTMTRQKASMIFILLISIGVLHLIYSIFFKSLSSSSSFHLRTQLQSELPFVPGTTNFSCDDLFTGSLVDKFNFTKQYYDDQPAFLAEIKRITGGAFSGDGHSAMFPTQHKTLHFLATRDFVTSICETGFNYGHSSFSFATAKKDNKILSFDIGYHSYTKPMMEYLNKTYPGKFTTVLGDSSKTLPKFIESNPSYKCNMFFVDGSHTYEVGYSDLKQFSKLSEKVNIIAYDDFPTLHRATINGLGRAWEQAKNEKMIVEIMRCTRKTDVIRGFTIGRFI